MGNAYPSTKKNNLPIKRRQIKPVTTGQTHNDDRSRGPCRSEGPYSHQGEAGQHDIVRGRVRDLQSRGKPRSQKNSVSADERRRAGPVTLTSTVFVGHSEQVLALAQHHDVLFSAAADGTAMVSVRFSLKGLSLACLAVDDTA